MTRAEIKKARSLKHAAYVRAFNAAVKTGFTGKKTGKGAWKTVRAYCVKKGIAYPGVKRVRKAEPKAAA